MYAYRILYRTLAGTILVVLAALLVGCGSSSSATASTTSTTPTAANCPTQDTGTVQSFSGSKLLISDLQGKQVQVTFSSSTRFSRETTVAPTALQVGERVSVRTTQNADSTYSATQITVSRAFTGTSPQTGQFTRGSDGTPNASTRTTTCTFRGVNGGSRRNTTGNANGSGNTNSSVLAGSITQVNKNAILVTDVNGNDYTIGLTSTTQITSQSTASASDIQTGQAVTVLGTNNGGMIAARSVTILLRLPNRTQG